MEHQKRGYLLADEPVEFLLLAAGLLAITILAGAVVIIAAIF
ncbi:MULTISPECIES: hypothetical protein [unclassified Rhizobium]|jgi:hypothetical protein|nr:hypothetical protein [Rhizobium sp. AN80A]